MDPDEIGALGVYDTEDNLNSLDQGHDPNCKDAEDALGIAPCMGSGAPTTTPMARSSCSIASLLHLAWGVVPLQLRQ